MENTTKEEFKSTARFLLQRRLGAGAFGVVYEAYDRELNAVVALKVLKIEDADALYRFKQEFRSLAGVIHPNLVTLYEMFKEGSAWFFTMSLVEGVNFLDFVRESDAVKAARESETIRDAGPPARLKNTAAPQQTAAKTPPAYDLLRAALGQLAEGISALHQAGKLHRDIKPSNVLVTPEGRVIILDFGLLTDLLGQGAEQSLTFAGTPAYMSPEQARNRPTTPASDWYCIGVMLYQALTGELPFTGFVWDLLEKKCNTDPPPPSSLVPDTPADLNTLCMDLLQREQEKRPSGAEVLSRLGVAANLNGGGRPSTHASRAATPFVGRSEQMAVLLSSLEETKAGQGVSVYVSGKSGIGKSALIHNFLDIVRRREADAVILEGRCYEQESVPYKALDSLVDALSRYLKLLPPAEAAQFLPRNVMALSRLFPVLNQVGVFAQARERVREIPDMQVLKRRAFGALRELLGKLAEQKTLVLYIDDLQWGDLDSISLLNEFLCPPDPPMLLLVVAYRSEDIGSSQPLQMLLQLRDELGNAVRVRELSLKELSSEEARGLTLELLADRPAVSAQQVEAVVRESGASPFFIHEFSRYLSAQHAPSLPDGNGDDFTQQGKMNVGEATLNEVLWKRISRLPAPALTLLELIAVAGRPVSIEAVKRATESSVVQHQSLAELRAEHLIKLRDMQDWVEVETYHDRIRETVLAHLPAAQLRDCHGRLASALSTLPHVDLETLAIHFQGAGDNERAARYTADAANQASNALAFNRAARLYQLTLELTPEKNLKGHAIRVKLGNALANAGRGAEAAREYLAAVEGADAAERLELQRRVAEQLLRSGHINEGLAMVERVLAIMGMNLAKKPWHALLSLLLRRAYIKVRGLKFDERDVTQIPPQELIRIDTCWSIAVGLSIVDVIRGADFQIRHLRLALKAGEPSRVARALAVEAGYVASAGMPSKAHTEKLLRKASALAKRIDHPGSIALTTLVGGFAAYFVGRWRRAFELTEEAEKMFRDHCTGVSWELYMAHHFGLRSLINLGELRELSRRLPALLNEAQERGDLFAETNLWIRVSYILRLGADEIDEAQAEFHHGLDSWSNQGFQVQHYWDHVRRIEIALYREEGAAAWDILTKCWPALSRSLHLRAQVSRIEWLHLRARSALAAALAVGATPRRRDAARLLRTAEGDARSLARETMACAEPLAQLIRAGIADAAGDAERAVGLLAMAETGFEATEMNLYAAVARRCRGRLLGGGQGETLVAAADGWMHTQSIKNTARLTYMMAPGRWGRT